MASSLDLALTFIPIAPGALSILGASAILYNILSDSERRFTTPYFRILFCLSVADITYAAAKMFSTFAAPKNTPRLYFASGNRATCNAQGFFLILGFIQPLYVASLSINYLMVIKYGKSDGYLAKTLEPWMHLLSLGYPLLGAIVALSLGSINSMSTNCYISAYPMYCDDYQNGLTCLRGRHSYLLSWIFGGSVVCGSLIVVSLCIFQVVRCVRKRWLVMKHQFTFQGHVISSCTNLEKQYRAATKQGLMYICAFIFVWVFGFIFRVSQRTRNEYLLIPAQIFNPLHGFFNFFIYTWPRYVKSKEENPGKSFWWLLKDSIITTSRTKRLRRQLSNSERRTFKKRCSIKRRLSLKRSLTERKVESSIQYGSGHELKSLNSPFSASSLEMVDDEDEDVNDEELINALATLQGLDSQNDDFGDSIEPINVTSNKTLCDEDIEGTSQ